MKSRIRVLLELLRLPNLFAVPGDILLGAAAIDGFHCGGFPWLGILASLCLYSAGLLFNDFFDATIDAHERPSRPIPSGRISRKTVGVLATALMLGGILLAWQAWWMAALLAVLILAYDAGLKKIPFVGILTMGACRGANIFLGGVCAQCKSCTSLIKDDLLLFAGYFTLYIFLVSLIARREAEANAKPRLLPIILLNAIIFFPAVFAFLMAPAYSQLQFWALFCTYLLLFVLHIRLRHHFNHLPRVIASYIRFLIPLQFVWSIYNPFETHSPILYILFPLLWLGAEIAGRRFSGS